MSTLVDISTQHIRAEQSLFKDVADSETYFHLFPQPLVTFGIIDVYKDKVLWLIGSLLAV